MMDVTCVKKERDKHNNIVGYILRGENGSGITRVTPEELKKAILDNRIHVNNLKLTSDGRLIDSNNSQIDKYIESCRTLGIKPLTIEFNDGMHIVRDIPNDVGTIVIPDFVDAIAVQKKIQRNRADINSNSAKNTYVDDKKIEEYLYKIGTKLDKIDRKTTILINKLDNTESKVEGVVEAFDKIKGIEGIDAIIDYVKADGEKAKKSAEKVRPLLNNVIDTMITDDSAFKLDESAITNPDSITLDGIMYDMNKPLISSKELYNEGTREFSNVALPYELVSKITPYVNYVYNTFVPMYNAVLRENKIRSDIDMTDIGIYLDSLLAFAGYNSSVNSLNTDLADVRSDYHKELSTTTDKDMVPGLVQNKNNGIKNVLMGGVPGLVEDAVGTINKFETIMDRRDMRTRARKLFEREFDIVLKDVEDMDKHIDREIYLFCLQYIYYRSCSYMTDLTKSGLVDKAILKTIMRFRGDKNAEMVKLELPIIVAYMASKLYIRYNYKLDFNISEGQLNYILKQKQTERLVNKHKDIIEKQNVMYGLIKRWMSAALHNMYINERIIYNTILKTFESEVNRLKHSIRTITNEDIVRLENKDNEA